MKTISKLMAATAALTVFAGSALAEMPAREDFRSQRAEAPEAHDAKARHAEFMKKLDTDGDGKLSEAERKAARDGHVAKMFDRVDENGDGVISKAEFTKMANFMRKAREAHGKREFDGDRPEHRKHTGERPPAE